jgi:radical SAM superfamily enzyme YgiQ (UPF0313 family)
MVEQGVIRPPSEANSLLVRVTRNCPWNRCLFCPAYKGKKFSRRSVEEIKRDIDEMAEDRGRVGSKFSYVFLDHRSMQNRKIHDLLFHPDYKCIL